MKKSLKKMLENKLIKLRENFVFREEKKTFREKKFK